MFCQTRIQKVLSGNPTLTNVFMFVFFVCFLVDEGKERIQMPLIAGHHRLASENAIEMAFRWRADDGLKLNTSLVAL